MYVFNRVIFAGVSSLLLSTPVFSMVGVRKMGILYSFPGQKHFSYRRWEV